MAENLNNNLIPRPPVVVVMGHIDHGKTTLLDYIRKTKVAEREAGGITQHVGAYEVEMKDKEGQERKITFLDTPGHEAFSKIRQRGAKIADVAILVVAADDGVKPQTEEALKAVREAGISFVVALNKTDKESANPDKVKTELAEKEVLTEDWGGKTPCVNISAKTGQGIDELLEIVLLLADLENLKMDMSAPATGVVIESRVDSKKGIAATLLLQNGTLKRGTHVLIKDALAPVRIFEDFLGKPIDEAYPSAPVQIFGFNKPPEAGAEFKTFESKKEAEKILQPAAAEKTQPKPVAPTTEENVNNKIIIPVIIKTDAVGSKEAVEKELEKIQKAEEKIGFTVLKSDVGDITEDDIKLASSGKTSIVLGFNVKYPDNAKTLAERYGLTVKLSNIIYELGEWLQEETNRRKPPEEKSEITGKLKVLKIFGEEKSKKIIGGEITEGKIATGNFVKILRRDFVLGSGRVAGMRIFKTEIKEGKAGEQVGLLIQTKNDIAHHDILEATEKPPKI